MLMDRGVVSSSAQGPPSEETRVQMLAMENLALDPELSTLYGILDRELGNVRLERFDNIRMVLLYEENRAKTEIPEESFDPIGQDDVNGAVGYWCCTRLFYDESGTAIRKVRGGRRSWKLRKTKVTDSRDGQTWCMRKLTYINLKMSQYSLGGKDDQPNYAICQISRIKEVGFQGARNPPPPHQPVRTPGGTASERKEIDQGSPSGTKNKAIGEPEAHRPSMTAPPSQNYNKYANRNKRKRFQIEESESAKWPIEDPSMVDILMKLRNIEELLVGRGIPDQSTSEIFQSNAASLDIGTEDNQCTMQVQASQHGAAGTSNESARNQDPNLSHHSYMPTQEGLHDYQRGVISGTTLQPELPQGPPSNNIFEWDQYLEFLDEPTIQFQAPQHGAAGIVNDSAMLQDQNLSHQPYGMANQWNAHVIYPSYPPGESSTHYNQGFNDDDVNTSESDFDG